MSGDWRPSCAVIGNGSSGVPRVSGGWPNRFEHEVGLASARDRARYAIGHYGPGAVGIDRVMESVKRASGRGSTTGTPRTTVIRQTEREHLAQSYGIASAIRRTTRRIETAVEWLPRPRQWLLWADYITGGNAVVLNRG
jgi:hypothetical protein